MDALPSNEDVQQVVKVLHSPACNGMLQQKNPVGKVSHQSLLRVSEKSQMLCSISPSISDNLIQNNYLCFTVLINDGKILGQKVLRNGIFRSSKLKYINIYKKEMILSFPRLKLTKIRRDTKLDIQTQPDMTRKTYYKLSRYLYVSYVKITTGINPFLYFQDSTQIPQLLSVYQFHTQG